jgi:hypothetical protein
MGDVAHIAGFQLVGSCSRSADYCTDCASFFVTAVTLLNIPAAMAHDGPTNCTSRATLHQECDKATEV